MADLTNFFDKSDSDLWNAFTQDDRNAFATIYERYYSSLYSYGYRVLPNIALVEDAIQDLFIDLWRWRHKLSSADSLKCYLFSSLRRKIFYLLKQEKDKNDQTILSVSPESSTDYLLIEQEQETLLAQRLTDLLSHLPERQLEVISLRYYQNFSTQEIAVIMGITEQSVRNTLHKALTQLRQNSAFIASLLTLLLLWLLVAPLQDAFNF